MRGFLSGTLQIGFTGVRGGESGEEGVEGLLLKD